MKIVIKRMSKIKLNTQGVRSALRHRYCNEEWVYLEEVRNGVGFNRMPRTADAIALNTWPSRGLELYGIEIKTSRADWMKELKTPEKAEEICRYCDRWWVAVGDSDIVRDGELPPTWGLLVPHGKTMIAKVPAPELKAETLSRNFVCSLMRNFSKTYIHKDDISEQLKTEYKRGTENSRGRTERLQEENKNYCKTIDAFREKSGVNIMSYEGPEAIGEAVRFILSGGVFRDRLLGQRRAMENILKTINVQLEAIV